MRLPAPRTYIQCLIAALCLVIIAAGTNAEPPDPSFDCAQANGQVETLICADAKLATLDRRMAERYAAALDVAGKVQDGNKDALNTLRAMQRGWIKGRNECWKAQDIRDCVEAAYLTREGALVTAWMLDTPIATTTYTCAGNPANEVAVFFFDTALPSIRIEYGDSIASGTLVPAASGSKYAIDFGGLFWTQGDSAEFAWREGDPMSCTAITR